jgi:hypothetical protein
MSDQANAVTLDRATYDRIVSALRYASNATSLFDLARASERCALLLIDLGEATDEGGCDE